MCHYRTPVIELDLHKILLSFCGHYHTEHISPTLDKLLLINSCNYYALTHTAFFNKLSVTFLKKRVSALSVMWHWLIAVLHISHITMEERHSN